MTSDNLTERDRRWWARRGQLQVTTCVEGLATVRFDPEKNEVLAMDHFVPLTPAVWDIQTNALVRFPKPFDNNRHVVIGIIISTGIREVNILTSIAHNFTGT